MNMPNLDEALETARQISEGIAEMRMEIDDEYRANMELRNAIKKRYRHLRGCGWGGEKGLTCCAKEYNLTVAEVDNIISQEDADE